MFLLYFVVLILANIEAAEGLKEELRDLEHLYFGSSTNEVPHYFFSRMDHLRDKIKEEEFKSDIGYKDHYKFMVTLGNTQEQKEYSRERDFVINAGNGDLEECKSFLDSGGDINANNNRGTALSEAAKNNKINICEFLIERGAQVDLFNHHGETPLMVALETGRIEICELLIQHGANIKVRRPQDGLSLSFYARGPESISLLKKYGLEEEAGQQVSTSQELSQWNFCSIC